MWLDHRTDEGGVRIEADTLQDAYDIITGGYVAKRGGIPPLTDTRPLIMRAVSLDFPLHPSGA